MHPNHFLRPVLIAAISLFPCTSTAVADPGVTADIFGQAAALTGPAAALGQDMRTGILAAFAVYLTVIQPDGSFKSIAALNKPGG